MGAMQSVQAPERHLGTAVPYGALTDSPESLAPWLAQATTSATAAIDNNEDILLTVNALNICRVRMAIAAASLAGHLLPERSLSMILEIEYPAVGII